MLKQRIITGVILAILVSGMLFYAPFGLWAGFCAVISLLILYEFAKMSHLKTPQVVIYITIACLLGLLVYYALPHNAITPLPIWSQYVVLFFWCALVPVILWRQIRLEHTVINLVMAYLMVLPFWLAMSFLRLNPSDALGLLLLMALVWLADIGAYAFGRLLGQHKLAPAISPGKSREGALGGLCCVLVYLTFIRYFLLNQDINPESSFAFLNQLSTTAFYLLGILLTAVSIYGDLFESWLKRCANIKDSSQLLPGHGGVYDRTDSLIAVLSVFAALFVILT